jgi:hypothetical protein
LKLAEGKKIVRSILGAARAPGKYWLKWDGTDNGGKSVASFGYHKIAGK